MNLKWVTVEACGQKWSFYIQCDKPEDATLYAKDMLVQCGKGSFAIKAGELCDAGLEEDVDDE